jgi:hypothetical protein
MLMSSMTGLLSTKPPSVPEGPPELDDAVSVELLPGPFELLPPVPPPKHPVASV